jgi:ribosomal protein L40E
MRTLSALSDDLDFDSCSYCGARIPADIVRCPKCGQYTDGRGPLAGRQRWTPRRLAALVIGAVAVLAFLSMILGGC